MEALASAEATAGGAPAARRPVFNRLLAYSLLAACAGASCRNPFPPARLPLHRRYSDARSTISTTLYQQHVQVHLSRNPIREGLLEPKKKLVRDYFKAAGSSSDDAAKLEEEAYGVRPTCDQEPALSRPDP
jgi:hypothetical protein